MTGYVHGYSEAESARLADQADALTELLHGDTHYPAGSDVLEAGCGVGAQTSILAARSPQASITATDISPASLAEAARRTRTEGHRNVTFRQEDILRLRFAEASFDHVFVCFVLEHLPDPDRAVRSLLRVLRPGGTITVVEGDHGSAFFHPDSDRARRAVRCLIDLQASDGGDALIGRRLFPLLARAGVQDLRVTPRQVYVDGSRPDLIEAFTRRTFTAMVEAVGDRALADGLATREDWDGGIADLYRTAEPDGAFFYTFTKAVGTRGAVLEGARDAAVTEPSASTDTR